MNKPTSTVGLERQLIAAVGWSAEQGASRAVDTELVADPVRRRILEAVIAQTDEHGGTGWMCVLDEFLESGDTGAAEELTQVTTSDGYPAMLPAIVARLEAARDRRREWLEAVAVIEAQGGRVAPAAARHGSSRADVPAGQTPDQRRDDASSRGRGRDHGGAS